MKKFLIAILVLGPTLITVSSTNAQKMMGGFSNSTADWEEVVEHTLREEQEGQELRNKLQAKEVVCENLADEQFGVLGEYFMGQMAGESHAAMNAMMIQTHGEVGEEQIHIIMGKRLSGCDTSATLPAGSGGWMPMMNIMFPLRQGFGGQGGGWSSPFGSNSTNNMMDYGFGSFGDFGWIFMILWWALIVIGIVGVFKWITGQSRSANNHGQSSPGKVAADKSALDILKERYARGDIDKKEFEEKKRDIA